MPVWDGRRDAWSAGAGTAARLARAEAGSAAAAATDADVVLVGYPGHFDLPAARRVARGRPVVFDPLVSLFDTFVPDRGRFRAGSLAAPCAGRDRPAGAARRRPRGRRHGRAGRVLPASGSGSTSRVAVCLVGAEDRLFTPRHAADDGFHALFVGKLIPLHGLDTILAAARLAPEIPFRDRRQRPARARARARAGNVDARALGRLRAAARDGFARQAARSGSSARRRRRNG